MNACVGIDVSRDTLDCTLLYAGQTQPAWHTTVPRTAAGIAALQAKTPAGVPWVSEPTGRYSQFLAQEAARLGQRVLLAPTKAARHALLALRPAAARTDRTDSEGLALFGLLRELRDYPLKSDAMDELDQLLSARRALVQAIMRLTAQQEDLPRAAGYLKASLATLKAELQGLDRHLAQRARKCPELAAVAELLRVPGVGPVTALTVTSCLERKQFVNANQFVAYCGLHLEYKDSGQKRGARRLSKHGDAELRRVLYLAAMANLRCRQSPFKDQYHRELAKAGMTTTGALCAVARKLAKLCWSLHRHRTAYDPERVFRQP